MARATLPSLTLIGPNSSRVVSSRASSDCLSLIAGPPQSAPAAGCLRHVGANSTRPAPAESLPPLSAIGRRSGAGYVGIQVSGCSPSAFICEGRSEATRADSERLPQTTTPIHRSLARRRYGRMRRCHAPSGSWTGCAVTQATLTNRAGVQASVAESALLKGQLRRPRF